MDDDSKDSEEDEGEETTMWGTSSPVPLYCLPVHFLNSSIGFQLNGTYGLTGAVLEENSWGNAASNQGAMARIEGGRIEAPSRVGMGGMYPPSRLGVWGSVVSSPVVSVVRSPGRKRVLRILKTTEHSFLYLYHDAWEHGWGLAAGNCPLPNVESGGLNLPPWPSRHSTPHWLSATCYSNINILTFVISLKQWVSGWVIEHF